MLKHIVCMKFKAGTTGEEIDDLTTNLAALPGKIPEIKAFEFGRDILKTERSYDFALVSLFADVESLKRYQVHGDHLPVIQKVRNLSESVIAVDFEWP